ncbi:chromate transporter [Teichococcus aestuarii]|uniref:chromate transporter n=1 Tax=Teichococcus aestuarii TaxID=568898 RepID=UPI003609093C
MIDRLLAEEPGRPQRMARSARRTGLAVLALWAWSVALLMGTGLFGDVAWFFARMAVVTFGGAYAVLAYVAQEAVEHYGWLSAEAMLAGLGTAETTPGPLILVLQFVGFLAGWQQGPVSAVAAALLTLWVTFAPCFAWIFLGAPFIERLHAMPRLRGALAAVTAAVVGVIANLAAWFALRLIFTERTPGRPALCGWNCRCRPAWTWRHWGWRCWRNRPARAAHGRGQGAGAGGAGRAGAAAGGGLSRVAPPLERR